MVGSMVGFMAGFTVGWFMVSWFYDFLFLW